jgi:alpha-L-fucosidase
MLREIGAWLAVNGEAIFGTRPFSVFGEGPTEVAEGPFSDTKRKPFTAQDVRFTTRGGTVYAIVLARPADDRVSIKSLGRSQPHLKGEVRSVELVGSKDKLSWKRDTAALHAELPAGSSSDLPVVLRISTR